MIDLNDVVRVVCSWNMPESSKAQLVWHYICTVGTGGVPDTVLQAIETAFQSAWAHIDQIIDSQVTAYDLSMLQYDFVNHRWDGIAGFAPASLDGISAGESMPHGAAALVKFHTEANRRQGRKYIHGLLEGAAADGIISGPNVVALAAFAADFDVPVTGSGITLTWCTFNTDDTSVLYETASKASQSIIAEAVFAYQRRRRPGVGLT